MYLFRIHIRPQGGSASVKETFDYCLENAILGVGWQIQSTNSPACWADYLKEAEVLYGTVQVCSYIKRWVSKGDLVWTRDAEGQYYLAQVQSGWEYWRSDVAVEKDIDLANIFRVKMFPVEMTAVPGKVVACFRPSRSIQEIQSKAAVEYSKFLWNRLSSEEHYQFDSEAANDIFDMLDDEETEDVIFMYLQSNGWYVLPNSRKKDTMAYEFMAVNPETGERAICQVKTGNSGINMDDFISYKERVFLFQPNEIYTGSGKENIVCLYRSQMLDFISKSKAWLPNTIQNKLDMLDSVKGYRA